MMKLIRKIRFNHYTNKMNKASGSKSIRFAKHLVKLEPTSDLAYNSLGNVYIDTGQYKLAKKCLLKAVKLNSISYNFHDLAVAEYDLIKRLNRL